MEVENTTTESPAEYAYTIEAHEELDDNIKDMTTEEVNKMVEEENAKNLELQKVALGLNGNETSSVNAVNLAKDIDGESNISNQDNERNHDTETSEPTSDDKVKGDEEEDMVIVSGKELLQSGFAYVLQEDNSKTMNNQSADKNQKTEKSDCNNESDQIIGNAKEDTNTGDASVDSAESVDDEVESKLVIDLSMGTSKCNEGMGVSPTDTRRCNDQASSGSEGASPVTGSSKRKRKANMDSVLSSILKKKSPNRVVDGSFLNPPSDSTSEGEVEGTSDSTEDSPPTKVHITETFAARRNSSSSGSALPVHADSFHNSQGIMNANRNGDDSKVNGFVSGALNLSKSINEPESDNGCLNLSKSITNATHTPTPKAVVASSPEQPLNLVTSTPNTASQQNSSSGRKNRRKRSVPIKCEKVEVFDANEFVEEYDFEKDLNIPMDLTPKSTTPTLSSIKQENSSPVSFARTNGKLNNGPMDLSKSNSPVQFPHLESALKPVSRTPKTVKTAANNAPMLHGGAEGLAANSKVPNFGLPMMPPAAAMMAGAGFRPNLNPLMAGMNPAQMKDFLELMVKMQTSFPNQNMMQANAQLMQFHALMQGAMLNNSIMSNMNNNIMNSKNDGGNKVHSDKNDNILKTDQSYIKPKVPKDEISENYQKFSLDFMQKNGGLMSPTSFMGAAGMNGFQNGAMPFLPNQGLLNQKGTPGRRRRSKDTNSFSGAGSLPTDRTTIPKLEDIPILRTHVDSSNPELVVETLKKLFPQQPLIQDSNTSMEGLNMSEAGGDAVRFFVKDNEQIQNIVDSMLLVCEIRASEMEKYVGDQGYKNICRLCNATFYHIEHLTKHVKKIHVVKRFQCSECERSFHDAGNYRQHMRVHDETDIPYECPDCKRRFRHKCTLKVHLRIHTGEKPFKCDLCGATFKISSGLQTHMRKHTGETPYACEFCSMRFKCQSNLKQHLFQHTQARPFTCDICNKSYSRKSIRDAHMLTHGKEFTPGKLDIAAIQNLSPMSDIGMLDSPEMPNLGAPEIPV